MPIGIGDEHVALAASVQQWAAAVGAVAAVRAAEDEPATLTDWGPRWAELGLATVALPEPYGGGGTLLDQAVVLEAAAAALVPGPLLATVVGALLVDDAELRAGVADGSVTLGLGLGAPLAGGADRLAGEIATVPDAPSATHLLLPIEDGWAVLPSALADVTPGRSPDLSRTVGAVRVDVPAADVRRVPAGDPQRVLLTLAAAEASGVARWCLDTAVEYAGVREQFGRRIGAFQAVKHLCAEMLEISESVTAAAWDAAVAGPGEQGEYAALVAGVTCLDGAVHVAHACIQVLGGVGFTFEHDAHLRLRRAIALRALVGGARRWAPVLADRAASGIRRTPRLELDGADKPFREPAREEAAVLAGLSAEEQRLRLAETGYLVPHWPAPYGLGAGAVQQLVIDEELAAAGVQRPDLRIGAWAAPTVVAHGTEAQRERFVAPTLRGEISWCQLFSEPGAGSDLASLRTRATRVDGGWSLTGQKVWTSLAQEADWGICLARTGTEGRPHDQITYFLLDMSAAGLTIRPLREMTGEALFNEVFLDDVFVPDDCVVGEVDGGWRLARTTLANERVAMAGMRLGDSVERAVELVEPESREVVGRAVALATVVKLLGTRATLRALEGQGPGAESSVAKLVGVRSRQDAAELVVELLGPRVLADDEVARAALHEQLLTRCLSIAGGTTQVLRNVAGERLLGLPRS